MLLGTTNSARLRSLRRSPACAGVPGIARPPPTFASLVQKRLSKRTQRPASVDTSVVSVGTERSLLDDVGLLRRGPVVSTFDMTRDAGDALLWTVNNVCRSGDKVCLVHVVCDAQMLHTITATGSSPSGFVSCFDSKDDLAMESLTEDVRSHCERLVARARERLDASEACSQMVQRGINYEVILPQVPEPQSAAIIGETLLNTAGQTEGRMLVLANHGPGVLADFGSVVRYCYQHSAVPLLLIPSAVPITATGGDVVLIVDSAHEVKEHYSWVAANLCPQGECIQVWHTGMGSFDVPNDVVQDMAVHNVSLAFSSSVGSMFEEEQPDELGAKVCEMLESAHIKAAAIVNSCRKQGLVREGLCGSLSSYLSRHCHKPLLLLLPAECA